MQGPGDQERPARGPWAQLWSSRAVYYNALSLAWTFYHVEFAFPVLVLINERYSSPPKVWWCSFLGPAGKKTSATAFL